MELLLGFGFIGLVAAMSAVLTRFWKFSQFSDMPWAGLRKQVFSTTRASFRQLTCSLQTLTEGYTKFSKTGKPFVVPDPSFQPQVFLPREHIKWLTEQSDSVLSRWRVRAERNALKYLAIGVDQPSTITFIDKVIGQCLTRKLDNIQSDVFKGVRESVDITLGLDENEWQEINVQTALQKIVDRTVTRAFFGPPLCHDEEYLIVLSRYVMFMGIGTLINFSEKEGDRDEPNDFVTQAIKVIMKSKDRTYIDNPECLAEQFLLLNFASLGSTASGGTNAFLDLLSADPSLDVYNCLRAEAAGAFKSDADWADPVALKSLVCTDSAMKESWRRSPIQIRGLLRETMAEGGITLPNGSKVPQGTWVGVPVQPLQHDERYYENPDAYDPFRFARLRKESSEDPRTFDAGTTSDTYLFFSHSRSACPGRWFATQVIKMLIAYVTVHYDIQPMDKRASNIIFGDANIPALSAYMKVRRRSKRAIQG